MRAQVPIDLRVYWHPVAREPIAHSKVKVAIVLGGTGPAVYTTYLQKNDVPFTRLWYHSTQRYRDVLPAGWIDHTTASKDMIKRVTFGVCHPGKFCQDRGQHITNVQQVIAVRECLLDYAIALLFNDTHLQTFLSCTSYFFKLARGDIGRWRNCGYARERYWRLGVEDEKLDPKATTSKALVDTGVFLGGKEFLKKDSDRFQPRLLHELPRVTLRLYLRLVGGNFVIGLRTWNWRS